MVKIYVVPLESLQTNLLQQVLRKIPVRPLCRLRMTSKFLNSHVEEYKNTYASRVFDSELDLLWSYSLSCPRLTLSRSYVSNDLYFSCKWGTYKENVTWDSQFSKNWRESSVQFEPEAAGKLSAIAFNRMHISVEEENFLNPSQLETLKNLNIHCQTLTFENLSADHVESIYDAVKCRAIDVLFYDAEDYEHNVSELAKSELCSKIYVNMLYPATVSAICEWMRKFRGFSVFGSATDLKNIMEDLYTTTDCSNLKFLLLRLDIQHLNQELTLSIPHETIWDIHWLPVKYRNGYIPLSIHLVKLQEKQAIVCIYDYKEKILGSTSIFKAFNIDAIGENERNILIVVKKKLRIWDSRREEEYLSADVDRRKEILREQFLACRR